MWAFNGLREWPTILKSWISVHMWPKHLENTCFPLKCAYAPESGPQVCTDTAISMFPFLLFPHVLLDFHKDQSMLSLKSLQLAVLPSITNLTLYVRNAGCLFKQGKAAASLISCYTNAQIKINMCFPLLLLFQIRALGASNKVGFWGTLKAPISLERALDFTNYRIHTAAV